MGNYLKMADKQKLLALLELGWSYRRIQRETGTDRETVARLDPRRQSKPAKVPTGPVANAARVPTGSTSACEPHRTIIEAGGSPGPECPADMAGPQGRLPFQLWLLLGKTLRP